MLCINPVRPRPGLEHGCGQCTMCRVNRRRIWTCRMVLESCMHPVSTFATLTYNDESLPHDNSLSDAHWRQLTHKLGCRYFGVGEYGDRSDRAHYHLILFGVHPLTAEAWLPNRWPYGFLQVAEFTRARASYTAGYVVKKLTGKDDERLNGRAPEFARMSRRPGIGIPALGRIAEFYYTDEGSRFLSRTKDVCHFIRFDGKIWPLGRTLVTALRKEFGIPLNSPERTALAMDYGKKLANIPELVTQREARRQAHYEALSTRAKRAKGYQ